MTVIIKALSTDTPRSAVRANSRHTIVINTSLPRFDSDKAADIAEAIPAATAICIPETDAT